MTFFGMMRVRNESRWIERVVEAQLPLLDRLFIFDDHSTDGTPEICEQFDNVTVFRSKFEGLDERRDKDWVMERLYDAIPKEDYHLTLGNPQSPYWALCLDGDEELAPGAVDLLAQAAESDEGHAYSVRILYAWNSPDQIRIDGVYRNFRRPSMFRLMNRNFRFQSTPWGGNLHCSSIPQELIAGFRSCEASVLHYGYIDADLRRRKYDWYNRVDPNNPAEDCYRHIIQGDPGGMPAEARLKHAGPMRLESFAHQVIETLPLAA